MISRRLAARVVLTALFLAAACAVVYSLWLRRAPPFTVRTVHIEVSGYKLEGDLYLPRWRPRAPTAVLFLHGSTPRGRRLALYPALCERLAERGCAVLNLDQRGHGASEGPRRVASLEDVDFVGDACAAARRLPEVLGRRPRRIVLAGHSFGAGVAAAAGLAEPAVNAVVSISPGRRIEERFTPDAPEQLEYVRQRRSRDMKLEEPMPLELIQPMLARWDIGQLRGAALPKPVLLIEGAREARGDLAFSRELVATISGPITHVVLPEADHYFGAVVIPTPAGDDWTLSRADIVDALADAIVRWLQEH